MPNPTYVLISSQTLASPASSVTFSSISNTYTDLIVKASYRGSTSQVYEISALQFNGLTTNLSSKSIEGNGSSASSITNAPSIYFGAGDGNTATANTFSNIEAYITNYNSFTSKSVSIDSVGENNATTIYSQLTAGLWSASAAITSITIAASATFLTNSTFYLYGINNS